MISTTQNVYYINIQVQIWRWQKVKIDIEYKKNVFVKQKDTEEVINKLYSMAETSFLHLEDTAIREAAGMIESLVKIIQMRDEELEVKEKEIEKLKSTKEGDRSNAFRLRAFNVCRKTEKYFCEQLSPPKWNVEEYLNRIEDIVEKHNNEGSCLYKYDTFKMVNRNCLACPLKGICEKETQRRKEENAQKIN